MKLFQATTKYVLGAVVAFSVLVGAVHAQPPGGVPPTAPPTQDALDALESNFAMTVTDTPLFISFQSTIVSQPTGLVIHPGGAVDPRAYAPIARKIAGPGYRVLIMKTPSELVVAGVLPSLVSVAMISNPDITKWALAGHSVGGVAAAQYIFDNPADARVKGLALWASFVNPAKPIPGRVDLKVASIYGTQDCLVPPATVAQFAWALPFNTSYVSLDGANHAQWGDYGAQNGDCAATITNGQQKTRGKNATIDNVLALIP